MSDCNKSKEYVDGKLKFEFCIGNEKLIKVKKLWNDIFNDTVQFEEYYFEYKCRDNEILCGYIDDELVSMVHLNPYLYETINKVSKVHYIVGVAVVEKYRKMGIMKKMLNYAIKHLEELNEIFTFLMPEKEEYYSSLGFEKIYFNRLVTINTNNKIKNPYFNIDKESIEFLMEPKKAEDVNKLNQLIKQKYSLTLNRDTNYFDMIKIEMEQQGGNLVFIYEFEEIIGYFTTYLSENIMYIERVVIANNENLTFGAIINKIANDKVDVVVVTIDLLSYNKIEFSEYDILKDICGKGVMIKELNINKNNSVPSIKKDDMLKNNRKCNKKVLFDEIV